MGIRDIIVHVDGAEATKGRVAFAIALAEAHDAHLAGVAFAPTALLPLYGPDVGFADMAEVMSSVRTQSDAALTAFEEQAAAAGISAEVRLVQGVSDEFPADFAMCARSFDLVVLGQPRDGDPLIGQYALVERCLFASGRPVIIVPAAASRPALETIVVAWDGSAEAARAVHDALIFLKDAKRVVVLVACAEDDGTGNAPDTSDIVAHLARHGIATEVLTVKPRDGDIGRTLVMTCRELEADMMVMGAFHHSRLRQYILGGVTLTLLEQATLPLFLAH
jgi:nucleotide-binding universal stress UspA family protein